MKRMPAVFVGHGSPMNALGNNPFAEGWQKLGLALPRPKAVLVVSAHWYTAGTRVMTQAHPRQIFDFFGFPKELYALDYPAIGAPDAARAAIALLDGAAVSDESWGIDHGAWSVLVHMFPKADIPVFQLSIDFSRPPEFHYAVGKILAPLREQGVLILGSGNVVHSFKGARFDMDGGHPWAYDFDNYVCQHILSGDHDRVVHPEAAGECARLAFQTPDHYYPLLYTLGSSQTGESIEVFNNTCVMGGFSMTGYAFG